ncbi:MAG: hypothetical protein HYZ91_03585 [Candidatus Omnitrophica bacterium]|nr:hypothetical protein [Candidatus Omnitrophota bacterium]
MSVREKTQISWQDYVAIVIRRRWCFIIPCVAIVAIAMGVGLSLPKIYRAETVLLLEDPKIMNPLMSGMAVSSPIEGRMRIIQEELLGWVSLSRLVHQLGLDQGATTPLAFEALINRLKKDITVGLRGGSLITLSYKDRDPAFSQKVLNTVTDVYIQRNIESQTSETETAIRFIESEMAVYKKKLEEAERALREFKELYSMEMPVAVHLNEQIIVLEVNLAQMLVENTEQHPTVVQTKRRIEELKRKRNDEIKRVIASAMAKGQDPEIYQDLVESLNAPQADAVERDPTLKAAKEVYQSWVQRLESPISGNQPSPGFPGASSKPGEPAPGSGNVAGSTVMSLTLGPRQEQELARLTRDYDVYKKTYEELTQRLELAKATQRLGKSEEGIKFKVIEPARLPLRPFSPDLLLIFCSALGAGLFIGACVAYAAEYLDESFQSSEEVQEALGLPVIGSISTIVTEGDLADRRKRVKGWVSSRRQWERLRIFVLEPLWSRIDQALVRWGL